MNESSRNEHKTYFSTFSTLSPRNNNKSNKYSFQNSVFNQLKDDHKFQEIDQLFKNKTIIMKSCLKTIQDMSDSNETPAMLNQQKKRKTIKGPPKKLLTLIRTPFTKQTSSTRRLFAINDFSEFKNFQRDTIETSVFITNIGKQNSNNLKNGTLKEKIHYIRSTKELNTKKINLLKDYKQNLQNLKKKQKNQHLLSNSNYNRSNIKNGSMKKSIQKLKTLNGLNLNSITAQKINNTYTNNKTLQSSSRNISTTNHSLTNRKNSNKDKTFAFSNLSFKETNNLQRKTSNYFTFDPTFKEAPKIIDRRTSFLQPIKRFNNQLHDTFYTNNSVEGITERLSSKHVINAFKQDNNLRTFLEFCEDNEEEGNKIEKNIVQKIEKVNKACHKNKNLHVRKHKIEEFEELNILKETKIALKKNYIAVKDEKNNVKIISGGIDNIFDQLARIDKVHVNSAYKLKEAYYRRFGTGIIDPVIDKKKYLEVLNNETIEQKNEDNKINHNSHKINYIIQQCREIKERCLEK